MNFNITRIQILQIIIIFFLLLSTSTPLTAQILIKDELVREINSKKIKLKERLKKIDKKKLKRAKKDRNRIITEAQEYLTNILLDKVFPTLLNTKKVFPPTSKNDYVKDAKGFVGIILRDIGFKFNSKYNNNIKGSDDKAIFFKRNIIENIEKCIKNWGIGVYIVEFDGNIGFIINDKPNIKMESLYLYTENSYTKLTELNSPKKIMKDKINVNNNKSYNKSIALVIKISDSMINKWILDENIYNLFISDYHLYYTKKKLVLLEEKSDSLSARKLDRIKRNNETQIEESLLNKNFADSIDIEDNNELPESLSISSNESIDDFRVAQPLVFKNSNKKNVRDSDETQSIINIKLKSLEKCIKKGRNKFKKLTGKVLYSFQIQENGNVTKVRIVNSSWNNKKYGKHVEKCLIKTFELWRFPRVHKGHLTVEQYISF